MWIHVIGTLDHHGRLHAGRSKFDWNNLQSNIDSSTSTHYVGTQQSRKYSNIARQPRWARVSYSWKPTMASLLTKSRLLKASISKSFLLFQKPTRREWKFEFFYLRPKLVSLKATPWPTLSFFRNSSISFRSLSTDSFSCSARRLPFCTVVSSTTYKRSLSACIDL